MGLLCVYGSPWVCVHACIHACRPVWVLMSRDRRHECAFVQMGTLRHEPSHQSATWKLVSGRWNFNVEMRTIIPTFKCAQEAQPIDGGRPRMMDQLFMHHTASGGAVSVCMWAGMCPLPRALSCVLCEMLFVCLFTRSLPPNLALVSCSDVQTLHRGRQ